MIRNSWLIVRAALLLYALFAAMSAQAAFTIHGDGTVSDTATGLMWDRCSWGQSGPTCGIGTASPDNWTQALGVAVSANSASYKGRTDWRLPNITELESLTDMSVWNPALDTTAFPNAVNSSYWSSTSSTTYIALPSWAWYVSFVDGSFTVADKSDSKLVRLVRNGPSLGSFDALAPWSPFNVVAVMGNASAKVNFSAPGGGGAVVSGYTVRIWALVFGDAAATEPVGTDIDAGSLSLTHTVIGLVNGTAYTFSVIAHSSEGDSLESVQSNRIVPTPTAGAPVCTLVATPTSIFIGGTSTLTANCTPTVTSYSWAGGTCAGVAAMSCTVSPSTTTNYSVTGSNASGAGAPSYTSVTVTGTSVNYSLSLFKAGTGSGTVTGGNISCGALCSASFASGTSVTLSATADSGSTFTGWGGACSGTTATCTLNMNQAQSVTATFALATVSTVSPYDGIYQWDTGYYLSVHQIGGEILIGTIYWVYTANNEQVGARAISDADTFDLFHGQIVGSTATMTGTRFYRACTLSYDLTFNSDASLTVHLNSVSNSPGVSASDVDCAAMYPIVPDWTIPRIY